MESRKKAWGLGPRSIPSSRAGHAAMPTLPLALPRVCVPPTTTTTRVCLTPKAARVSRTPTEKTRRGRVNLAGTWSQLTRSPSNSNPASLPSSDPSESAQLQKTVSLTLAALHSEYSDLRSCVAALAPHFGDSATLHSSAPMLRHLRTPQEYAAWYSDLKRDVAPDLQLKIRTVAVSRPAEGDSSVVVLAQVCGTNTGEGGARRTGRRMAADCAFGLQFDEEGTKVERLQVFWDGEACQRGYEGGAA
eukprot:Hpha_TRINITY_DN11922_c0_g1::TRINITY_DN11922_c0_g1_i1::g.20701::m.20701